MKNQMKRALIRFSVRVLITVLLVVVFSIFMRGMVLTGIPKIDEVQKVTISYPELTDEVVEVTEEEQIELAVKLTGFLNYSLFEKADTEETPMVTIVYVLDHGESVSISANRNTVWWKGKAYAIKEKDSFIDLTKEVFF